MRDERTSADETVTSLSRQLRDADPAQRVEAVERMLSRAPIGTGSPMRRPILTPREIRDALSVLVEAASDDASAEVRALAVNGLGVFGRDDAGVLEPLLRSLRDPAAEVRVEAANALGEIHGGSTRIVTALAIALRDSSRDVRLAAALALEARAVDTAPATRTLIDSLGDEHSLVGDHAARALRVLWAHRPPHEVSADLAVVPRSAASLWLLHALGAAHPDVLLEALDDQLTRGAAIDALAERGATALAEGLQRLATIAPDTFEHWLLRGDPPVWRAGHERIWTDAMTMLAREGPTRMRRTVIAALPAVERSLRVAVLLEALAKDPDDDVRDAAECARAELMTILGLSAS